MANYFSKIDYDIELTLELVANPDVVILDLVNDKSKRIIASLKKYSNNKFLPIVFINAETISKSFYYDNFPFSSVFLSDVEECELLEQIKSKINILYKSKLETPKLIKITTDKKDVFLSKSDIIYIQAYSNKTVIHCKNDSINCKHIKLADCKDVFGDEFLVCHRKYAVNKKHISAINKSDKTVYLYNNRKSVKIGRVFKESFFKDVYV